MGRAVSFARKQMNTKIVSLTSEIKASESRLKGEISIVSGEVMRDRQAQIRVNRRVNKEMSMIIHTANVRHSQSKRARGKLRAILNANKAAAAQEVAALAKQDDAKESRAKEAAKIEGKSKGREGQ